MNKYCPKCRAEYLETTNICNDCKIVLVKYEEVPPLCPSCKQTYPFQETICKKCLVELNVFQTKDNINKTTKRHGWIKILLISIACILLIPLSIFLYGFGLLLYQYIENIPASFHKNELRSYLDSTINRIKENDTVWITNNSHPIYINSNPFEEYDSLRARLMDSSSKDIKFVGFTKETNNRSSGYYFIFFNVLTRRTPVSPKIGEYGITTIEPPKSPSSWDKYFFQFEYNDKRWWICRGEIFK